MTYFSPQFDPISNNLLIRSSSTNLINANTSVNPYQRPDSYSYAPSYPQNLKLSSMPNKRNSLARLNDFRKKVHEVFDLCKNENTDVKTDLSQVINEERKVYDLLVQNPSLLRRTVSHQNFPQATSDLQHNLSNKQNIFNQSQKPESIKTPYRHYKLQKIPESHYYIPSGSQVGRKQTKFPQQVQYPNAPNISQQQRIYHPQDLQNPKQFLQPVGGAHFNENLRNAFLKLKNDRQIQLNTDAVRLIEEAQRKVFEEIEQLRQQKLSLMQRLNQEITNTNNQKRKNVELQNLLAKQSTQAQVPDGDSMGSGKKLQAFQREISRLSEELQRTNEINYSLRLEISNRGSGVSGIEELLRQGEAIRQQTLRLIKLKEGTEGNLQMQDLERRLASAHAEREAALNEVRLLRERLGGVSQMRILQQNRLNDTSALRTRSNQPVKHVAQYGDLIEEMKRISGN